MRIELGDLLRGTSVHWAALAAIGGLFGMAALLWCRARAIAIVRRQERRIREELEAYELLDERLPSDGDVCRLVAQKSSFYRVAMLRRDGEGCLYVASSAAMDDAMVEALNAWGKGIAEMERRMPGLRVDDGLGVGVGSKSFTVALERAAGGVVPGRAIVVPLRTSAGRMLGALVVGADSMMSVPRRMVDKALLPLETLAVKLGRTMENATLADRLLRAERLAELGSLIGDVAHALNSPLTTVLGFAELIAGTSEETRVKNDSETIVREALRMRQTVDVLLEFWRLPARSDEPVELAWLVLELAKECREKLEDRGVQLVVQVDEAVPAVRGSKDRLRQMLEYLLNNAAQAVASATSKDGVFAHEIRVTLDRDDRLVYLTVSDTGRGFLEPGRVFDPLSMTRQPGEQVGLGVCYGLVREHGGEISACNLHPRGATVVVELPVGDFAAEKKKPGRERLLTS